MEKLFLWFHSQQILQLVLVITTNQQTFDANGQKLRILLFGVSKKPGIANSMTVIFLMSTLMKCSDTNKRHSSAPKTIIN